MAINSMNGALALEEYYARATVTAQQYLLRFYTAAKTASDEGYIYGQPFTRCPACQIHIPPGAFHLCRAARKTVCERCGDEISAGNLAHICETKAEELSRRAEWSMQLHEPQCPCKPCVWSRAQKGVAADIPQARSARSAHSPHLAASMVGVWRMR